LLGRFGWVATENPLLWVALMASARCHPLMKLRPAVATNLRKLRHAAGLSQEQLASAARIHRNYGGMIERQERSPTIDVIEKIAEALKVEPETLLLREFSPRR
jgi:ribosome-binding protein aMBF1 (putative translation factor)